MKTVKTVKPNDGTFANCCRFEAFSFGSIRIDGVTYEHDVLIDRGQVRKRQKKPSKKFREAFGHTPLSTEEKIPWKCRRLVVGTGTGALPVMDKVKKEAKHRHVQLLILPTAKAIDTKQRTARDSAGRREAAPSCERGLGSSALFTVRMPSVECEPRGVRPRAGWKAS